MTIEEIGSVVAQRLLQGSMNHQEFINYYNFLGLEGYKLCHEYHFIEQTFGYLDFVEYYITMYNKLVPTFSIESLSSITILPDNWYNYTREDMDINTRRNAIKNGLQKYVHWEKDTKRFLEDMTIRAIEINEIGFAEKLKQHIKEVDKEIKKAEKELLEIRSTDYDLPTVISKQGYLCKKYGKKLNEIKKRKEFDHDKSQRD